MLRSTGLPFAKRVSALLTGASVLCLSAVSAAHADTYVPAFTFKTTTTTVGGGPFLLGYRFSTDFDKVIKAIGVYKTITRPPNNSLGIWNFDIPSKPVLLFQAVITTEGDCTGDFCWHPASEFLPTVLPEIKMDSLYAIATAWGEEQVPAGIDPMDIKIVSAGFNVGDNAYNTNPLSALNEDLAPPSGLIPDETDTAFDKSYFTANLSFETYDSLQVPSPLPLIGATAAFGWSRKIRRKIKLSS